MDDRTIDWRFLDRHPLCNLPTYLAFDEEMSHAASKLIAEEGLRLLSSISTTRLAWCPASPLVVLINGFVYDLVGVNLVYARIVTLLLRLVFWS
ncbi:hypothetical protein KFU94_70290 [Chloroflexi bacterium TSY]|nr:hypothetical protein [Chloroflexi bacterium TSY]